MICPAKRPWGFIDSEFAWRQCALQYVVHSRCINRIYRGISFDPPMLLTGAVAAPKIPLAIQRDGRRRAADVSEDVSYIHVAMRHCAKAIAENASASYQ
jgi:hypothetical protein